MITNEDDNYSRTAINLAMEKALDSNKHQEILMTTHTDDIPGIDEIAEQYRTKGNPTFTTTGQIGVHADGTPIIGETRIYIVEEPPQENHMTHKKQSEAEAAAEAAAANLPKTGNIEAKEPNPDDEVLKETLSAFADTVSEFCKTSTETIGSSEALLEDAIQFADTTEKSAEPDTGVKQEPAAPEPEKKSFGFKSFFTGIGKKASDLKDKIVKPKEKPTIDQEATLVEVKRLLSSAVADIQDGMAKLPKGVYAPLSAVA